MALGLACSIQKAGTTRWITDPSNDKVVNVARGIGSYSREFLLPSGLGAGKYHVSWGLLSPDFTTAYDFEVSSNALTITIPPPAEDQSDNSESFSVQVAAFKQLEEAKSLYENLLYKGYKAKIEPPASEEEGWYRVIVGKFRTREDAVALAEELHVREKLSYVIVQNDKP